MTEEENKSSSEQIKRTKPKGRPPGSKTRKIGKVARLVTEGYLIRSDQLLVEEDLYRMNDDDKFIPSYKSLTTVRELMLRGFNLETIRTNYFFRISEKTWARFKKLMFSSQIQGAEDVAVDLLSSKDRTINSIKEQITLLKQQQLTQPRLYHKEIIAAYRAIQDIESDTAKRLVDIGAVGTKKNIGVAIQIINNVPRPDSQPIKGKSNIIKIVGDTSSLENEVALTSANEQIEVKIKENNNLSSGEGVTVTREGDVGAGVGVDTGNT